MSEITPTKQQLAAMQSIVNLRIPDGPITPGEAAEYSRAMLLSLKKIAEIQGQTLLAHLLSLAAQEAQAIAARETKGEKKTAR